VYGGPMVSTLDPRLSCEGLSPWLGSLHCVLEQDTEL